MENKFQKISHLNIELNKGFTRLGSWKECVSKIPTGHRIPTYNEMHFILTCVISVKMTDVAEGKLFATYYWTSDTERRGVSGIPEIVVCKLYWNKKIRKGYESFNLYGSVNAILYVRDL